MDAGKEPGEPNHGGFAGGRSVWWTWTAPISGTVRVDTIGSSFDTLLGIYRGESVSGLTLVAQDDDHGGNGTSQLLFTASEGVSYQVAVDGYLGATGTIRLSLWQPAGAPVMLVEPTSQFGSVGGQAAFLAVVGGTEPLVYQWHFEGAPLEQQTSASLTLSNLTAAHVGSYQLLVSNAFGQLASAMVSLSLFTNVVEFSTNALQVLEADGLNVALGRTGFTNALTLRYTVAGTAEAGSDFIALPGSLDIGAGLTDATLSLATIDDALEETNRTIIVTLEPAEHYVVGANASVTITLVDDDPNVRVTALDPSARELGEDPGVFLLTRSGELGRPLTVQYSVGGSARNGLEYTALPGATTLPVGASTGLVEIKPLPSLMPGDKTVVLSLLPDAAYRVRTPGQASLRILGNRPPRLTLVGPAAWSGGAAGEAIHLEALAEDPDGTIPRVEFFDGLRKLGEAVTPPYRWVVTPQAGLHAFLAVATDDRGVTTTSASLQVEVGPGAGVAPRSGPWPPSDWGLPPSPGGNADSFSPVWSADGQWVAWVSLATDLASSSPFRSSLGTTLNVFARELETGRTILVSHSAAGGGANHDSWGPSLSREGRWIVFQSSADNLTAYDVNQSTDIFVRDLDSGRIDLVSARADDRRSTGNGPSSQGSVSLDGRLVLFESLADDLVADDTNRASDVFLRDLVAGTTRLISRNAAGTGSGNVGSEAPVLCESGRRVAFLSAATNLTDLNPVLGGHVFVRDLVEETTVCVSRNVPAILAALSVTATNRYRCYNAALDADGRYVAFKAAATNFTGPVLLLRHDLQTSLTDLIATNATMPMSRWNDTTGPSLSADGQSLAYEAAGWVYLWTEVGGRRLLSARPDGSEPLAGSARSPVLSADGRRVTFLSQAPDLLEGTRPDAYQLYARSLPDGPVVLAGVDLNGAPAVIEDGDLPALSVNGNRIAYSAADPRPGIDDSNPVRQIVWRDLSAGTNALVSARAPNSRSIPRVLDHPPKPEQFSGDARFVVVSTLQPQLVPSDTNLLWDVLRLDTSTGARALVSVSTNGWPADGASMYPVVSADGQVVAFASTAGDLARGDTNRTEDVYVRDLSANRTVLVSSNRLGLASANARATWPALSADGQWVAFVSSARDLDVGSSFGDNLFLREWQSGILVRVTNQFSSRSAKFVFPLRVGPRPNVFYLHTGASGMDLNVFDVVARANYSAGPVLSRPAVTTDGRFAAYRLKLAPDYPVMVFDFAARSQVTASNLLPTGLAFTNLNAADTALSEDGRFVAYVARLDLDSARDRNLTNDIYVFDRVTGSNRLVSVDARAATAGDGPSSNPSLSAEGRFLAFRSRASNLVPGRASGENLYLRDLESGLIWLMAGLHAGPGSGWQSESPVFAHSDQALIFRSDQTGQPIV